METTRRKKDGNESRMLLKSRAKLLFEKNMGRSATGASKLGR